MMNIGVLGNGQLARMLNLAAVPLGVNITCLDLSQKILSNDISAFVTPCDIITFENENISLNDAEWIQQKKPLYPSPEALKNTQDRLTEKQFIQSQGIKTAPFYPIDHPEDFKKSIDALGLPLILKTRRLGYDGKGQYLIKTPHDGEKIIQELYAQTSSSPLSLIAEGFVSFNRELSIIAARNSWETVFYPLVENHHESGILRYTEAPYSGYLHASLQSQAENIAKALLDALDYRGIFSIEFFEVNHELIVNELAPRVHNSGHWTIEGAHTSQFENHLRAIMDLPLGNTMSQGHSLMINAIGTFPELSELLKIPFCHVHDYQKAPRPDRKVGHVTLNHQDAQLIKALMEKNKTLQNMITHSD